MQPYDPDIYQLFAQLGLDNSDTAIERFILQNSPLLPPGMPLHEAPFWNDAQKSLLREAILEDAEWALVVERLDALLRQD